MRKHRCPGQRGRHLSSPGGMAVVGFPGGGLSAGTGGDAQEAGMRERKTEKARHPHLPSCPAESVWRRRVGDNAGGVAGLWLQRPLQAQLKSLDSTPRAVRSRGAVRSDLLCTKFPQAFLCRIDCRRPGDQVRGRELQVGKDSSRTQL